MPGRGLSVFWVETPAYELATWVTDAAGRVLELVADLTDEQLVGPLLPSRQDTVRYVQTVAERVAEEVTASDATDVVRHFARYTVHHHDTHSEALTYTRQTMGLPNYFTPDRRDVIAGFRTCAR